MVRLGHEQKLLLLTGITVCYVSRKRRSENFWILNPQRFSLGHLEERATDDYLTGVD